MKKSLEKYNKFHSQLDLPFLETPVKSLIEIFNILEAKFSLIKNSEQKFIDIGSGNGQVVIFAAMNYHIKSIGVEINGELVKEARERIKQLKKGKLTRKKNIKNIKIINNDLYQISLNPFDFIYIYSLPSMQKYLKHVFSTAKVNAIIISYEYPLVDFENILIQEYFLEKGEGEHKFCSFFYKRL